jgi:hypothetical protein
MARGDAGTQRGYGIEAKAADRGRFLAYGIAAFVAASFTAALLIVAVVGNSGTVGSGSGSGNGTSGFIFFEEFHTVLLLDPGAVGANTIDVAIAYHDGTVPTNVSGIELTVGQDGRQIGEYAAEPLPASPGVYRATGVSIPSAGDWDFGVTVSTTDEEPVSDTTVIEIGASSGGS